LAGIAGLSLACTTAFASLAKFGDIGLEIKSWGDPALDQEGVS